MKGKKKERKNIIKLITLNWKSYEGYFSDNLRLVNIHTQSFENLFERGTWGCEKNLGSPILVLYCIFTTKSFMGVGILDPPPTVCIYSGKCHMPLNFLKYLFSNR